MKSGQLRMIETAGHFKGLAPFVKQFKEAGAYVIHKCVAIRHAKSATKLGVGTWSQNKSLSSSAQKTHLKNGTDAISMDGFDCAGHPGEYDVGNWVLFAVAARELEIPFIASGGCANGSQLAAALCMGAEGMNMGTRWLATVEAPIHENVKRALVSGDENSTTLVMRSVRSVRTLTSLTHSTRKSHSNTNARTPNRYEIPNVCSRIKQQKRYSKSNVSIREISRKLHI